MCTSTTAGLSTSGTSIVNENGYPVRFRGTTWYGFNVPNYGEPSTEVPGCWVMHGCQLTYHKSCNSDTCTGHMQATSLAT